MQIDHKDEIMLLEFGENRHPVFRATSPLSVKTTPHMTRFRDVQRATVKATV